MRLLEAIVDANHRALAGDVRAGIRPSSFAGSLPLAVFSCFDPRMHPLLPEVLAVPEEMFIWLTGPGALVVDPEDATALSLGLACAAQGAKEIAVIGHTDCQYCGPRAQSVMALFGPAPQTSPTERMRGLMERLPDERAFVVHSVETLRQSPFVPAGVPVHGLVIEITSGRLQWVSDGYGKAAGLPRGSESIEAPPAFGDELPPIGRF